MIHDTFTRGVPSRALLLAAGAAFLLTATAAVAKPSGHASQDVTYSGRALAFQVDGVTQPQAGPIVVCDTGALPATGGVLEQHASNVNLYDGALTIDQADASVTGIGPEATAETRLTNYHAHFITEDGKDVVITAAYISATADVAVNRGGHPSGNATVDIEGLAVNGQPITVTGAPNQVVNLPDDEVKLVLNEQVSAGGQGSGDVAVAAVHFYICSCMEGHFGLVSAGISAGSPPPAADCGKVTGGGWITGTPSGAKGTFGVSGGIRQGASWGHLTYVDHGSGMKVESTAVTGFQLNGNTATITYDVTVNGASGTATVQVTDNGDPGRNDTFAITLSTGYTASGDLGGTHPGGGNIQVHTCPPGWD